MIKGYSYTLNYAVKPPDYREDFFMRNSQTKKLVEIIKQNPSVEIPGVKFYIEENLVIRSV